MAKNGENKLCGYGLALLRVVLGVILTYHGYLKLFTTGPTGFKATVTFFAAVGLPLPLYSALLVAVLEFAGGLLLILGLLTRWSSMLLFIQMLVALAVVHAKNGFMVGVGGYEYVLLILASLFAVFACGAGKLAAGSSLKNRQLK